MGSPTKTTKLKRSRRNAKLGKENKKERAKSPTPKFPIDPNGAGKKAK